VTVANNASEDPELLTASVRVPDEVVFRSFAKETVVLNLKTGLYHGLNPTAGKMLDELDQLGSVREVAAVLAREYERPVGDIERDVCKLCQALLERGLLTLKSPE
jgi:hypothetical protein